MSDSTGNQQPAQPVIDDAPKPRFYVPSLDGMRAVAIAIVFLSHAGYTLIPGGFGVTLFFFLIGYLITTLLVREFEAKGTINLPNFYWRRVWRIFPPMYATLAFAVTMALLRLTESMPTVPSVTAQALHLSNYANLTDLRSGMPWGSRVLWSLAIEEHFYLAFPFLALFLLRRYTPRGQAIALLLICTLVLVWRLVLEGVFNVAYDPEYRYERIFYATDTRIDAILFGCVMGVYLNPINRDSPQWSARKALLWTGAAVIFLGCTMLFRNEFYRNTFRYTLQSLALFPIFYAAIQQPNVGPFRLLNIAWVRFIGVLSYSLYLVHQVFMKALRFNYPEIDTLTMTLVAGVLSLGMAYLFLILLERPAARMRKRYASLK